MAPSKPYDLSAAVVYIRSKMCVDIHWKSDSQDDMGYEVHRRKQGDPFFVKIVYVYTNNVIRQDRSYTDYIAGAKEGDVYEYKIIGFDYYRHYGPYSDVFSIRIKNTPDTPYGLSAAIKHIRSNTYAHVFWMVSSIGDVAYELYRRKQGDKFFFKVATVPAHNPSTEGANWLDYIAGAKDGDVYEYRVVAYNYRGGYGDYSEILTVRVKDLPDTPYGLSAAIETHVARTGSIPHGYFTSHVFWMVSSYGDRSYELERRRPGYNAFTLVARVPAHNPSTEGANKEDTLPGGTRRGDMFEYRVRAYNSYGYSPYSQVLMVKV